MRRPFVVIIVSFAAAALLYAFIRMPTVDMNVVRNAQAKQDAAYLAYACKAYHMEYGAYPAASEQTEILKILAENNQRHIAFIERTEKNTSNTGTFDDPWGTPYVFDLRDLFNPIVFSAGPDRRPHSDDDVSN